MSTTLVKRHMITVCIFCLLCATHAPCSSHAAVNGPNRTATASALSSAAYWGKNRPETIGGDPSIIKPHRDQEVVDAVLPVIRDHAKRGSEERKTRKRRIVRRGQQQRNADGSHYGKSTNAVFKVGLLELRDEAVDRLFHRFGNGQSIDYDAFRRLLAHLDRRITAKDGATISNESEHPSEEGDRRAVDVGCSLIVTPRAVSSLSLSRLNRTTFIDVCPVVLHDLFAEGCSGIDAAGGMTKREQDVEIGHLPGRNVSDGDDAVEASSRSTTVVNGTRFGTPPIRSPSVWAFSLLAVTVISACGLLGLAVIPLMQSRFYQPLLQFFVALAVGTLAGDALLHLLPHAMDTHHHHHTNVEEKAFTGSPKDASHHRPHDASLWKGFVAMLGLICFFALERMIQMASNWRRRRQMKSKLPSRVKVMKPDGTTQSSGLIGGINAGSGGVGGGAGSSERECKHKYSSFPMCYEEIKMLDTPSATVTNNCCESSNNIGNHRNDTTTTSLEEDDKQANLLRNEKNAIGNNHGSTLPSNNRQSVTPTMLPATDEDRHPNNQSSPLLVAAEDDNEKKNDALVKATPEELIDDEEEEYTVILREHESRRHHGHTHAHGHVHSAPRTLSSVAWMVVMGDGLHNFTDGMAIGAAFATGLSGGLSTSVAVFCHELPHELGDFAVLLKAGMTVKQALVYNLMSSFLCLLGNVCGVWLGNTESASGWIFALAAGMFLYIALVDMVPELSDDGDNGLVRMALHLTGTMTGLAIMTTIAYYEQDLKHLFGDKKA